MKHRLVSSPRLAKTSLRPTLGKKDLGLGEQLMKKIIEVIAVCAVGTMLVLPGFAKKVPLQPARMVQYQCTPESKLAWYNEFRENLKNDQAKAYELANKFLACPAVGGEKQITDYLKKFVTLYAKASRKDQVSDLVYNRKDYAKAFEVGKAVLADEPENVKVMIDLAYAGYAAATANNTRFNDDAIHYAKKSIQLIEAGKSPDNWTPYVGKEEALAYLNNVTGMLTVQNNPSEGLPYLIKAAQFESKLKKLPFTYGVIAGAYEAGEYARLAADYRACCEGKDETPQSRLALENINQVIDRMIDAYARAVALAGTDPANQAAKKEWVQSLRTWYKYRHNQSEAGLNELVAGISAKFLMPPLVLPLLEQPEPTSTTVLNMNRPASSAERLETASESNAEVSLPHMGRYYALVIGNNAYQFVPRLKTAENDARATSEILREKYGFESKLLLNATRQQILAALGEYRRKLEDDANLLIYYAGHGYYDTETEKGYWLPVDATKEDSANWIIADDVTSMIKAIPAKHILIVSDSCYSGTITRGLELRPTTLLGRSRQLKKLSEGKSRILMASGGNEPVADGGGGGHSVFANSLLRALSQIDQDAFTAQEIFVNFISEAVTGRSNQTPEYNPIRNSGHVSGDFIFIRKNR